MSIEVAKESLPSDWEVTTLKAISTIQAGIGFPKDIQGRQDEEIPFYKVGDISQAILAGNRLLTKANNYVSNDDLVKLKGKLLQEGTIVFAKIGEAIRLNRRAILSRSSLVDNNVMGVKALDGVEGLYLYYYLTFIKLDSLAKATTVPSIRKSQIEDIQIPIAPFEQQKRIVAKIEELFSHIDAGISSLNKAKQLLKQYRQSVLKAAVTGELTKQWREDRLKDDVQGSTSAAGAGSAGAAKLEPASKLLERILKERRQKWETQQLELFKAKGKVPKDDGWKGKYKEPLAFDAEFEVPEAWVVCPFEQLILELKNGISKKPSEEQGLAILRISAVRPMVVYKDDVRFLPENFDSKDFEIEDGDLLFTRYNGNPEFVGVCGKVKDLKNKTVYPDKLMRARPVSTKKLCTDYLELSLNCGISKDFIRSVTKTTAGQSGVAGGDVKKCPTVLPTYEEQVEIANIVSEKIESMKRLDIELDIHLTKAEKNKQSILASAFSGRLDDEGNMQ